MKRRVKAIFSTEIPSFGLIEYFLSVTDGDSFARWPVAGTRSMITIGSKPLVLPSTPESVRIDNRTINWNAVDGAYWYRIYRDTDPAFTPGPGNLVTFVPSTMVSFIDGAPGFDGKPLSGNQFYRITTVDKAGNESSASEPVKLAARMDWWRDARFGMFIHWDMSSVAGTEISWSRLGPKPLDGSWGSPAGTGGDSIYDNLYKQFNPVNFNAKEWVRIAKDAGMKYMVFTTKHHGGFAMWDTKFTDYSIMSSPFKRDVVKELSEACHDAGLKFGIYYSPRDWYNPNYGVGDNSIYEAFMTGQLTELLTNYGAIDVVWFDSFGTGSSIDYWHADKVLALVRNLQPQTIINNRCSFFAEYVPSLQADFDTPEQTIGSYRTNRDWESCMCVVDAPGGGWSYRKDGKVKPFDECIRNLVSCATGDGNLLLDVGPDASGIIPADQAGRLAEMGDWLRKYGESIYGTEGGPFRNGPWGGYTFKGNRVFLHLFDTAPATIEMPVLTQKLVSSRCLTGGAIKVSMKNGRLTVQSATDSRNSPDTIIELTFDQEVTRIDQ
jgi:alpha-L-fucosidase